MEKDDLRSAKKQISFDLSSPEGLSKPPLDQPKFISTRSRASKAKRSEGDKLFGAELVRQD